MMNLQPGSVGFDFDGVIADIGEAFIRLACTDHGYCNVKLEELRSFQVEHCLDIPTAIIEIIFNDILVDSLGIALKPLPGAIETLTRLTHHSDVTVITARPDIEPVIDWFDHYCETEARKGITLIATGDHDNKEEYIRTCGLTHFIDDRTITCLQLAEAGLNPIVFSQPWNRDQHNLPSVSDWDELSSFFNYSDSDRT